MTETLLLHIGEAIALGVIVAVLLRLFRTVTPVRRIGGSLMLIAVLLGLDLIITGSGWPGEDSLTHIIGSVAISTGTMALRYSRLELYQLRSTISLSGGGPRPTPISAAYWATMFDT